MVKKLLFGVALAALSVSACKKEETATGAVQRGQLSVPRGLLVASGLGTINGLNHTNTVEALRCNHGRGFRWFEIDLVATAEGELVGFHKGDEREAGLKDKVWNVSISDVESSQYAKQFPIVRFSKLLAEADRLAEVVLVLDTDGWSNRMEEAVSRTIGYGPKHPTRMVLQVYKADEAQRIATLAKELDAGLILNLSENDIEDDKVEELLRKHQFLAVVANAQRFTPWLADRLHALNVMLLVQTINEHRDIVNLTRAGADGFYTDRYLPYEALSGNPMTAMECGATKASSSQLRNWSERSLRRQTDFRLPNCSKRQGSRVELSGCDERASIRNNLLAVPPKQTVHVELEAEAGTTPAKLWIDLVQKQAPKTLRERELVSLAPSERKTIEFEVALPQGSLGVEARLGVATKSDSVIVRGFQVYHGEEKPVPPTTDSTSLGDAGE